jgi:hypothetical protein
MMARGVIESVNIAAYDLVVYYQEGEIKPDDDFDFSALMRAARRVTRINRRQPSRLQFFALLRAAGKQKRTVFLAQIDRPFILALFRVRPRLHLKTFDEGGFNIATDGPYHAPPPRKLRRLRDAVAIALFPRGPIEFIRRRSEQHYTTFPPEKNVLSALACQIDLPWASFVQPTETDIAQDKQRIMVLPCMKDFAGPTNSREAIISAARECDLVVRHPRDEDIAGLPSHKLSSPVEGIISFAAKRRPVQVLHYASTVGQTLAGKPNIDLIDLYDTPTV